MAWLPGAFGLAKNCGVMLGDVKDRMMSMDVSIQLSAGLTRVTNCCSCAVWAAGCFGVGGTKQRSAVRVHKGISVSDLSSGLFDSFQTKTTARCSKREQESADLERIMLSNHNKQLMAVGSK